MNATALSAGNSAVRPETQDIFASEEGIIRALSLVRHSPLPKEEKDKLRDLFLSYTGTADESARADLKSRITGMLSATPALASLVSAPTPAVSVSASKIGSTRPVPSFTSSEIISTPTPPAAKAPTPEPTPTPALEPEPIPAPLPPPPPPPEPVSVPEAPQMPAPEPAAAPTNTDTKAKIDAIKRDINGKVGNPVNLIDMNENIGREYMAALLDAMKRSARGDGDLTRLDTAYQAALVVISKGIPLEPSAPPQTKEAVIPQAPAQEPVATPSYVAAPLPAPIASPAKMAELSPAGISGDKPRGLFNRPIDEVDQEEMIKTGELPPRPSPLTALTDKLIKKPAVSPESELELEKKYGPLKLPDEEGSGVSQPAPSPIVEVKAAPKPIAPKPEIKLMSSGKLRPLKDTDTALPEKMAALKESALQKEAEAKKPITDLNAPEIDQGLRQLLAEWSLFKSSGFLRRTPSGIENPMYKQLAPLPMASVIAGRFEGVTPDIKHTIADYMSGWRYEQGIIHELGETFEHYLRRVVKEILAKQRQAKAAGIPV